MSTEDDYIDATADAILEDPATRLMLRLAQHPDMAGVLMYVTYPDGSKLSARGGMTP